MNIPLELMPLAPADELPPEVVPPKTMVVRYGYLKQIGEFVSELTSKVGCGTKLVCQTNRGTEICEMLTTTCGNGGCNKSITREKMLSYFENSGGPDYPFSAEGRVLRVATLQDLAEQAKLNESRKHDLTAARELTLQYNLPMRISEVEYLLGRERVMFYFTSEHRVDFRQMVRDLAHQIHARIELRQVGARDEARLIADYEKCGQHCCCKQFLKVLTPISMRSAKVQKATLDPAKISGRCGRLMCCLRYEDQTYEELRKKLPKRNTRVKTEQGEAWVIDGQILTQLVMVQYDDGKRAAVALEHILAFDQPRPKMANGQTMQSPNDRMPEPRPMPTGPIVGGPRKGPPGPGMPVGQGEPIVGGPPLGKPGNRPNAGGNNPRAGNNAGGNGGGNRPPNGKPNGGAPVIKPFGGFGPEIMPAPGGEGAAAAEGMQKPPLNEPPQNQSVQGDQPEAKPPVDPANESQPPQGTTEA